jgi:hypothetical protein
VRTRCREEGSKQRWLQHTSVTVAKGNCLIPLCVVCGLNWNPALHSWLRCDISCHCDWLPSPSREAQQPIQSSDNIAVDAPRGTVVAIIGGSRGIGLDAARYMALYGCTHPASALLTILISTCRPEPDCIDAVLSIEAAMA